MATVNLCLSKSCGGKDCTLGLCGMHYALFLRWRRNNGYTSGRPSRAQRDEYLADDFGQRQTLGDAPQNAPGDSDLIEPAVATVVAPLLPRAAVAVHGHCHWIASQKPKHVQRDRRAWQRYAARKSYRHTAWFGGSLYIINAFDGHFDHLVPGVPAILMPGQKKTAPPSEA